METSGNSTDNQSSVVEMAVLQRMTYHVAVPVLVVLCLLSTLCNLVVLLSLRWIRRSLSPTLCFSISLAVADALASVLVGVGLVLNSYLPVVYHVRPSSQCYGLVLEAFRLGGIIVSVLHLLALAVNHYVGIVRPLHYAATVTRRTTYFTLATIWTCPFSFMLLYFSSVRGEGFLSPECKDILFTKQRTFRWLVSTLFFTPLVTMMAMYARIFFVVKQHQQGLVEYPLSTRQLQKNVKAIVTTLFILGTYVLGLMPAVFFFVLVCIDCSVPFKNVDQRVAFAASFVVNSLIILKALTNPAIYAARMPEIREALYMTRCWITGAPCVYTDSLLSRTETMSSSLRMYSMRNGKRIMGNTVIGQGHRAGTPSSCCSMVSTNRVAINDKSAQEDLLPESATLRLYFESSKNKERNV